jgi:hypothetical protein
MKSVFLFLAFSLASNIANAQAIENSQSVEFRYGKTFSVGAYAGLRYRTTTSTTIDVSVAGFINSLQRNGLNYTSYGIDLMGEYYTPVGDNTEHLLEVKAGMGATVMIDNELFIYKQLPFGKRLNYGVVGELTGEWCVSENISLTLFTQQKFLFNKNLSSYCFTAGLGIKLNLD